MAEVCHGNKIICLREIREFIGSGRSLTWTGRLEIAQTGQLRNFTTGHLESFKISAEF
jgi:hypothetical protein